MSDGKRDRQAERRTAEGNDLAKMDRLKERDPKEEAEASPGTTQGGAASPDEAKGSAGRKPPSERDRDYDPDGERIGRGGDPAVN